MDGAKKLAKGKGAKQKLDYEVCGTREVTAMVKRVSGNGRFKVTALRS